MEFDMRFHQILLFIFFMIRFLGYELQAQTDRKNVAIVQDIYNAIEHESTSTIKADLVANIEGWNEDSEAFDRYTITLSSILQNQWQQLTVESLHVKEMYGGLVIAKGKFIGRQATECDFVTSTFHHVWSVKDGKIIDFKEELIK